MKKRRMYGMIFLLALAAGLTGCGHRSELPTESVTESDESEETASVDENAQIYMPQEIDTGIWQDEFAIESEATSYDLIKINAEVKVPDSESFSIAKAKKEEFGADYKEELAKKLFTDGTVWTRETSYGVQTFNSGKDWKNDTDYSIAVDYENDSYAGERDGIRYTLDFIDWNEYTDDTPDEDSDEDDGKVSNLFLRFRVQNVQDVCPDEISGVECSYAGIEDEGKRNQCTLTEEEAVKTAEQFLKYLGISNMSFETSVPLAFIENENQEVLAISGYRLTFSLEINHSDVYKGEYLVYHESEGGVTEASAADSMKSEITLDINDKGIVQFIYDNPMHIVNETNPVAILPVYAIQKIMKDILLNDPDSVLSTSGFTGADCTFASLSLLYFRMRNPENPKEFSYVPVWCLTTEPKNYMMPNEVAFLMINAIDGSRVDIFYEYTGKTSND